MNLRQTARIPSSVMARAVGNEIVILDLASGTYFGLDEVGARVWQLLVDRTELGQVVETLLSEYAVGRDQLEGDIKRLVTQLRDQGLVELDD